MFVEWTTWFFTSLVIKMSWFSLDCKNLLDHNLANCNLILFGRLNLQLDHNLHSHKLIKVSIQYNTEKYISHISLSMPCCHKLKSPSLASSILPAQHMSCPERVFDTNCYEHKFLLLVTFFMKTRPSSLIEWAFSR